MLPSGAAPRRDRSRPAKTGTRARRLISKGRGFNVVKLFLTGGVTPSAISSSKAMSLSMSAETPSIVLVSARPATVDAVRAACSDANGGTIQMSVVSDTAAVAPLVDNKQTVVVLLDCMGGT